MQPGAFSNFPSGPSWSTQVDDFSSASQLANFDFSTPVTGAVNKGIDGTTAIASTMLGPSGDALGNYDGGGLQLNAEVASAVSLDYIQGQSIGTSVYANRLGKLYQFEWKLALDSASLCVAMVGMFATNTNLMGTNVVNGFGLMCNQAASGAPAGSFWWGFLANGAGTQYSGYTQLEGPATDTLEHTLWIRYQTDPTTLYAGSMTFGIDTTTIGSVISQTAVFPAVALRNSFAFGNGSAVARQPVLYFMGSNGQF